MSEAPITHVLEERKYVLKKESTFWKKKVRFMKRKYVLKKESTFKKKKYVLKKENTF